ncbi:hypothetical protein JW835_05780 [bacterium]|nr:hypothetical protein [bacterium]
MFRYPLKEWLAVFITLFIISGSIKITANSSYRFEHITVDHGLSESMVNAVIQDHMGFLWIGTDYGLNRYNGYNFKIYKYNRTDSTSLTSNRISTLYLDRSGQLWVGTDQGLNLYNREQDNFIRYQTKPDGSGISNNSVNCIFEDSQHNFWIATIESLDLYDRENNRFKYFLAEPGNPNSLTENSVINIAEDDDHQLWMATSNGLTCLDLNTMKFSQYQHDPKNSYSLKSNDVNKLIVDYQGTLWIGYRYEGLSHCEKDRNGRYRFIHHDLSQNGTNPSNNNVYALIESSGEKLWLGSSNGGLNIFDIPSKTYKNIQNVKSNPFSLSSNSIHSICADKGGNVWVGTYNAGLSVIKKYKQAIHSYWMMEGDPNSLSHNSVTSFIEGNGGKIWIGTDGGGLDLYDPETGNYRHFNTKNSGLNRNAILDITQSKEGYLWLCTWGGGVNRFNPRNGQVKTFTKENAGLISNDIMNLEEDHQGNLWIATNRTGLVEFNPKTYSVIHYTTDNSDLHDMSLTDIEVSHDGDIYIGGYNGLCIFNIETRRFATYRHDENDSTSISSNVVTSIFEASDGTVWTGTQLGLNRFDKEKGTFKTYDEFDGLANESVMQVVEDDHHDLWISTKRGLSHFNPETDEFKNYFQSDGLQSNDFNRRSGIKSNSGHLYFGGIKGFSVFHPDSLKLNENPPPVVITDFQLFNRPVAIGKKGSPIKKHISISEAIELTYKQNEFSFEFVSLDFTAPEKNQYAYILEGYDDENAWHYVGTQRRAIYTNMNPGNYTFRVKASNNDGIWNEEGASVRISISPPFWATWWFRIVAFGLIAFVIGMIYRIRVRSLAEQQKLLQLQVEERTAELVQKKNEIEDSYQKLSETGRHLASNSKMVNIATAQINTAMKEVKEGAISQNDFVMQTREIIDNLLNTIQKVVYQTKHSSKAAENTVNAVETGTASMQSTLDSMQEIEANVDEIWNVMKNLMKHSAKIDEVIRFIEDVASRVNVLALNAQIEAVKAGETGRGFKVVANEIRDLAKRATESTYEIADTIAQIQGDVSHIEKITRKGLNNVKQSSQITHEGRAILDKICKSVEAEKERLLSIVSKVNEMQQLSKKVRSAIDSVAEVSEKNKETVEQVNASTSEVGTRIEELSALAQSLEVHRKKNDNDVMLHVN